VNTIDRLEVEIERREEPDGNAQIRRETLSDLLARWLERAYRARELPPRESAGILQNNGRKPLISPPRM
jgi:hypothetical protein